jgi:hypothetical protein
MLGLLQVASLLKRHLLFAKEMNKFCNDPNLGYPFMVSQFGITRLTLEVFRSGKLNPYANSKMNFIDAFDDFYIGATAIFYQMYKSGNNTPATYGTVVQQFEEKMKAGPMEAAKKSQSMPTPIFDSKGF